MLNERDSLLESTSPNFQRDARSNRISLMLRIGTLLGLAIVVGRVVQLQVAPSDELSRFIEARTTSQKLKTVRGDLLDRRGRVLATSRIGYRVIVDPVVLERAMDSDPGALDRMVMTLGEICEISPERIALPIIKSIVGNNEKRVAAENESTNDFVSSSPSGVAAIGGINGVGQRASGKPLRLSRYRPVAGVIDQDQTARVRVLMKDGKLPGVTLEHTPVRVQSSESSMGSIVGKLGVVEGKSDRIGVLGAEKLFDDRLRGVDGSLTYIRDVDGRPLWVQRGAWIENNRGQDVRLSIDLEIQRQVQRQLERGVEDADASGGRAIVLDPNTGEILAMCDVLREIPDLAEVEWWDPKSGTQRPRMPSKEDQPRYRVLEPDPNRGIEPALAHNRCLLDVYEPGSTFKPFAWTLAKSQGLLPDDEILEINKKSIVTSYGRVITDAFVYSDTKHWDDVLRHSSNIGMSIATERLSFDDLRQAIKALGFGDRTGIGLGGESAGIVTSQADWGNYTQTSVGMGYEVSVTPIQMARGFSVFARKGDMAGTLPEIRLTAAGDRSKRGMLGDESIVERVFKPEAARRTIAPMQAVAENMDRNTKRQYPDEPEPRYSMFGKSGTSHIAMVPPKGMLAPKAKKAYFEKQHYSSFIVAAPAEDPKIVVLVVIDDIGPDRVSKKRHYGSWVAGPVVRRIVEGTLPYLGVSPDLDRDQFVHVD
jgi:cell division protein FtsI (penicillin-binding protein 3)